MIEPFGWLIFIVTLALAVFFYFRMKKWHVVAYLASIGLYVFTIIFAVDAFDLGKTWILLILIVSALLMMYIGRKI